MKGEGKREEGKGKREEDTDDKVQLSKNDNVLISFLIEKYNVEKDSLLYKAACLLLQRLWAGSICISIEDLKKEIPGFNDECFKNSPAVGKSNEKRPLIYDEENLYIQRYFVYQTKILNKIENLCKNKKFHIITGGPGTGKTTSLADILRDNLDKKILLAAPTGKAAFRMKESLLSNGINLEAKTLHRLLRSIYLSVNFRHTKENPLDADIIAIDECSMIEIPMMAKLLEAVPENCDLYLLGDKNQLSPVEAGTVFADICRKFENNTEVYEEKKKNYRSKEAAGIIELSKQILDETVKDFSNENVKYFEELSINELFEGYSNLINSETIEEALASLKSFQVLCAIKSGRNGTGNINRELLEKAKKSKAKFTPIIITENNYPQGLFNGDAGVMDKKNAYFTGENGIREFPLSALPGYDNAFAITIHKSQGSEYDRVAVVYPETEIDEEQTIFTKELLYTAITRAKKECLIYGSLDLLLKSCQKQIYRASGIR